MSIILQTNIDPQLWSAIEKAYENGDYHTAIVESVLFMGHIIREKAGVDSDGIALVGEAFTGDNPRIQITNHQTETDKNIQKGVEFLLRGIYTGVRNPRFHQKSSDTAEDADAIILFINYLLRLIGRGKGEFDKDEFLGKVFDADFPDSEDYANLLAAKVPMNRRWDILIEVYREKNTEQNRNQRLHLFVRAILCTLPMTQQDQFWRIVSGDIERLSNKGELASVLRIARHSGLSKLSREARIRLEWMLLNAIKAGLFNSETNKLMEGAFGTWATMIDRWTLHRQAASVFADKLGNNEYHQAFVLRYCVPSLFEWFENDIVVVLAFKKGLEEGRRSFYDTFQAEQFHMSKYWTETLAPDIENFVPREFPDIVSDDDVPF